MRQPKLPRRRIQRAFYRWLAENRQRLPYSLSILSRTDRQIECRIVGMPDAIRIILTDELNIYAEKDNECWDTLLWADCRPQKQDGSNYVCPICTPEGRPVYPSREALWRGALFEPLLRWMNCLISANRLLFYESSCGSTWAKLDSSTEPSDDEKTGLVAVVSLNEKITCTTVCSHRPNR